MSYLTKAQAQRRAEIDKHIKAMSPEERSEYKEKLIDMRDKLNRLRENIERIIKTRESHELN